jgi:hypothetical protein
MLYTNQITKIRKKIICSYQTINGGHMGRIKGTFGEKILVFAHKSLLLILYSYRGPE